MNKELFRINWILAKRIKQRDSAAESLNKKIDGFIEDLQEKQKELVEKTIKQNNA